MDSLGRRVARAERRIRDATERGRWDQVHRQRCRWAALQSQRAALQEDMEAGRVRLCFGSKRFWRKQHHLAENGYASHQEWLRDWRAARSDEFFVPDSRETAGCLLCVVTVADDGSLTLRLRLPDCFARQHGKYLTIQGVRFAHGHEQVLARRGLGCSERIPRRRVAPVGPGVQVAFSVPVRKRVKHMWTYWDVVAGQLGPALAAQHRLGRRQRPPNPVPAARRAA